MGSYYTVFLFVGAAAVAVEPRVISSATAAKATASAFEYLRAWLTRSRALSLSLLRALVRYPFRSPYKIHVADGFRVIHVCGVSRRAQTVAESSTIHTKKNHCYLPRSLFQAI